MNSSREIDVNGWMEIKGNPISKVGVFPYYGSQISEELDPNQVYMIYRPAEELADPECIESFKLLPWTNDHPPDLIGSTDNFIPTDNLKISGVTGEEIYFEDNFLKANLKVFSEDLAKYIQSGKTELSIGYQSQFDLSPGVYEGQKYVAIQRKIRGNHLSLVEKGRSGKDVRVLDQFIFNISESKKNMADETKSEGVVPSQSVTELTEAIKSLLPLITTLKQLASAASTEAASDDIAEDQVEDSGDMNSEAVQQDTGVSDDTSGEMTAMDKNKGASNSASASSMDSALKKINHLSKEIESLKQSNQGNFKQLLAQIKDRDALARQLSEHPNVGVFDSADKTLGEVAEYGIKKLGIECPKGQEVTVLKAFMLGSKQSSRVFGMLDTAQTVSNTGKSFSTFLGGEK